MHGNVFTSVAAVLLFVMLIIPATSGAQVGVGISLERLGILTTPGTGARPISMGYAYTAVSDDAFSLLYNPAGLAQIRRKEVSFGLHHTNRDVTNTYLGLGAEQSGSYTSLGHFAFIYPYPTYRGSLVLGFGVFRAGSSDLETLRNAYLSDIPATVENIYTQSGNIYQYHFGVGIDISPQIAVGADLVIWDESIDFIEQWIHEEPGTRDIFTDDVSVDMDGASFNLGLLVRMNEIIRAGFMFASPTWISFYGDGVTTDEGTYYESDPVYGVIDEEYTLPMQLRGGLSASLAGLLLSADVAYIDYSQTKYEGQRLVDDQTPGRPHVLDAAWNFFAGAEFTFPNAPVRLRGGYSYMPLSLKMIEEISYLDIDEWRTYYYDAETVRERQFFSFGAGVLLDRVLAVDAAVMMGSYERDTGYLVEEQKILEVVLSGTYRF
jgi:long-subunit fatty acid transport protein